MSRGYKEQTFEREGREENLSSVIKTVKNYIRNLIANGIPYPTKIVFFTLRGEGPMMAYNQLGEWDLKIIAVTFPATYSIPTKDGGRYTPEIPDKVAKFFDGVEIPIVRARLPFDKISGAESHNQEMLLMKRVMGVFGGSMPLAIQAVLQAADSGLIPSGEEVIAVTGDTALLVTTSTTQEFLSPTCGLMVNEVICKPRNFTVTRPKPKATEVLQMPSSSHGITLEGKVSHEPDALP